MGSYAVIITYSWDDDVAVYLFDTFDEATNGLAGFFTAEVLSDTENGFNPESTINADCTYASITNYSFNGKDVTEFRVGNVYD